LIQITIAKSTLTDTNSTNEETKSNSTTDLEPPIAQVAGLVVCFLFAIGIIVAGYIHGGMHIEKVFESLK
jgi:hypothetical protein